MEIIVTPKKEQIRIDQVTGKKIKLRVAAYARVSTDLEDQRNSFEFQKEEFESRIKQNPDWEFVKMYADHGISGTQVKHRKGFLQMIHDADNGKIDLILTKSISRFARNTVDLLTYVRKLAAENVSIFFEKENIMTNRDNVNLILTMYASIAESESINISDNVKWGVRKRMKKNSLKVPVKKVIGYSRTDDGTWYLNDDAQLAKNVFIYFLQGYTYRQIVELMKNDDKEGKFQWRPNTIHRILTNEKYKGFVIHQKTVTLDPLTHKQVKNKGIEPMYTIRDHHPKIVDEETFDLIQLILKRGDKETPTHSNYFPLAGLVVCEECGRTLRRIQYAHNKEIVLTCKGRSKQDLNYKECSSDVIPYHAFKEITKKVINEIKQSDSISSSFTMNLVDELSSDNYIPEINKLNRQIEDTKKEINDLVKEQVNSTEMVGYDSKFKILKTKLKNLQNEVIRYENLAKKNFSLIKNKKQIELFLNKNDMDFNIPSMRDIIYQIIHKKDGSLRFILKGSNFDSLSESQIETLKNSTKPKMKNTYVSDGYCVAYETVILEGK